MHMHACKGNLYCIEDTGLLEPTDLLQWVSVACAMDCNIFMYVCFYAQDALVEASS